MNGNKTTATSSEERRMQRGISVLAFFVPAFIMLVLFIIRGIYPFGDRSFLFSDMYHQYMPFLSEFVHKIKAGEGLFYSYNVGIGSNFLALYVYYLASPFNWLVFLLPEEPDHGIHELSGDPADRPYGAYLQHLSAESVRQGGSGGSFVFHCVCSVRLSGGLQLECDVAGLPDPVTS